MIVSKTRFPSLSKPRLTKFRACCKKWPPKPHLVLTRAGHNFSFAHIALRLPPKITAERACARQAKRFLIPRSADSIALAAKKWAYNSKNEARTPVNLEEGRCYAHLVPARAVEMHIGHLTRELVCEQARPQNANPEPTRALHLLQAPLSVDQLLGEL